MKKINDLLGGLFSDREGVALITTLWILAMLSALVAAFSTSAILHTQMTDALTSMGQGYDIARAGLELWMGQLRADAIRSDQGIIMTEIMNYYPEIPVRINEVDASAKCDGTNEYLEIYNAAPRGSGAEVDVSGWWAEGSGGKLDEFSSGTVLGPGEFAVTSGSGSLYNSGDKTVLYNSAGDTVDTFAYADGPDNTYQVLPDGWNGYKPAEHKMAADSAWIDTTCTIDATDNEGQTNGKGMWLKVGDAETEGVEITQYDKNKNVVGSFNFALDVPGTIKADTHFLPIHPGHDTGTAVLTNGIDTLASYYKNGSDSARVVNTRGALPDFSDTTMYVSISVPKPEPGDVTWSDWWYTDTAALPGKTNWSNVDSVDGQSASNHEYLVRYDTGLSPGNNLVRGDSDVSKPDPGSWRPRDYTGAAADYVFSDSTTADGRLYVSELYDTAPLSKNFNYDRLIVTKARDGYHAAEWLEIYNPTSDTFTFESLQICGAAKTFNFADTISPRSYFVLEDNGGDYPHGTPDWTADNNSKTMNTSHTYDGVVVKSINTVANDTFYNRVGWYRSDYDESDVTSLTSPGGKDCYTGTPKEYQDGSDLKIARKGYKNNVAPYFDQDNEKDFEDLGTTSPPAEGYGTKSVSKNIDFVELLLYGPPQVKMSDKNEYVEIYNTSTDTKTATNKTISDQLPSSFSYDIVTHPDDPDQSNGDLGPNQPGLIMPVDASYSELGITQRVDSGAVRLFALEKSSGNYQFFTEGLSNEKMENLSFNGQNVLTSSSAWDPAAPVPRRSREKAVLDGPDDNPNWPLSGDGGTPGVVGAGDNFADPWGWGGELFSGVSMYERVYLPSLSTSYQDGDIGYFKMRFIEDEAGKRNLLNSGAEPYMLSLSGGSNQKRLSSFYGSDAEEIIKYASGDIYGDTWLTPGEFFTNDSSDNNLIAGSISTWEKYRHLFSGWRSGASPNKININTAPFEVLRGIPINSDRSVDPAYVTTDMALEIIERRSGDPAQQDADGNYVIPLEDYTNNNAEPFSSDREACDLPAMQSEDNFDCATFQKYAKVGSDGIFRANVQGVTLTDDGDTMNVTYLDVIVDRREIQDGTGDLKIIYMRKN